MWYFAWILGVGLAVAFAVLNGLWHEMHLDEVDKDATFSLHKSGADTVEV